MAGSGDSTRYVTIYPDGAGSNTIFGDGIKEISSATYPSGAAPFFTRGGYYGGGSTVGIFTYSGSAGVANPDQGFRSVIIPTTSGYVPSNNDKEETDSIRLILNNQGATTPGTTGIFYKAGLGVYYLNSACTASC